MHIWWMINILRMSLHQLAAQKYGCVWVSFFITWQNDKAILYIAIKTTKMKMTSKKCIQGHSCRGCRCTVCRIGSQAPLHSVCPCMCLIDMAVFFSPGTIEKSLCTRPITTEASGPLGLMWIRFDLFFRISPSSTPTDIFVFVAKNDSFTSYDPSYERPIQSGHSS